MRGSELLPLLAYLSIDQVIAIAEFQHESTAAISEILLALALITDPLYLAYLDHLLRKWPLAPVCHRVLLSFVEHWRTSKLNEFVVAVRSAVLTDDVVANASRLDLRQSVLTMTQRPPAIRGWYHDLRMIAYARFLHPLKAEVDRDDVESAWSRWTAFGELDALVDACIEELCGEKSPAT